MSKKTKNTAKPNGLAESPKQTADRESLLVPAERIGRALDCTGRYVHMLADAGLIPQHRIGKRLVRYHLPSVLKALGVDQLAAEAIAGGAK